MDKSKLFKAQMTARPKGQRVGWVASRLADQNRVFVENPSTGLRDSLWKTEEYEWVRGLFFDGDQYWIEA